MSSIVSGYAYIVCNYVLELLEWTIAVKYGDCGALLSLVEVYRVKNWIILHTIQINPLQLSSELTKLVNSVHNLLFTKCWRKYSCPVKRSEV